MSEACEYPHCDCKGRRTVRVHRDITIYQRWKDNCKKYKSKKDNNGKKKED